MYVWLSAKIAKGLFDIECHDQSEQAEWTRYFIEIVLLNVLKTALVLFFGLLFNVLYMTIVSQFVFFLFKKIWIRLACEIKLSLQCSMYYSICGYSPTHGEVSISFSPILWLLIAIGMFLIFVLFAPQKTENSLESSLSDGQRKRRLLATFSLFVVLSFSIDLTWLQIGIFAGTLASAIMVLPFFKPIIEGDVFYESYQKFFK